MLLIRVDQSTTKAEYIQERIYMVYLIKRNLIIFDCAIFVPECTAQ